MKITKQEIREMIKQRVEERCQKGYMTHPTRKTKVMFGKKYRNCVKAESIDKELISKIEKAVLKKLKDEGGAAGLDPLVKATKDVEPDATKKEVEALLKKMKKVRQHRDGDYISEGIQYHIDNKLPITECVYRVGSEAYFRFISEVKRLNSEGKYTFSEDEQAFINENADLGEWAWHDEEGRLVPLDFPFHIETLDEDKKKGPLNKPMRNTGSGKKYKVYVRDPKTGNVRTITYGDAKGGLEGNWNSKEARASFAKRHNCAEKAAKKNAKLTAGYWACRAHKDFGKNVPGRFW